MIITNIDLENFGIHKKLSANLDDAVVLILGPNGGGKTTLLTAIKFLFTGMLDDRSETYIHGWGTTEQAKNATVTADFIQHGKTGKITRKITKSANSRALEWDGETYTKDKDVEAKLKEILGVDKEAIDKAVFIPQGDLSKLLFGTPSEKEELFSKILLLDYMRKVSDICEGKIKILQSTIEDLSTLWDDIQTQRSVCDENVLRLRAEVTEAKDYSEDIGVKQRVVDEFDRVNKLLSTRSNLLFEKESVESGIRQLLSGYTSFEDVERLAKETNVNLTQTRDTIATLQLQKTQKEGVVKAEQNLTTLKSTLTTLQTQLGNLPVSPLNWESEVAELEDKRNKLRRLIDKQGLLEVRQQALASTSSKLIELCTSGKPNVERSVIDTNQEVLTKLVVEGEQLKTRLELITTLLSHGHSDNTVCPVCNGQMDSKLISQESKLKVERDLSACRAVYNTTNESLKQTKKIWEDYDKALASTTTLLETNQAQVDMLEKEVAQLVSEVPPGIDAATIDVQIKTLRENAQAASNLTAQIDQYQLLVAAKQKEIADAPVVNTALYDTLGDAGIVSSENLVKALEQDKIKFESLVTKVTAVNATLLQLATKLEGVDEALKSVDTRKTSVDVESVKQELAQLKELQKIVNELNGRYTEALAQREQVIKRQDEVEERMRKDQGKRELVVELQQLKEAFSKKGIPHSVVKDRFNHIARVTKEFVSKMGANFTVDIDMETPLSFTFTRVDQGSMITMPQNKLSGGQKVRLAVAFLFSIQQLLVADLGLLALDEPSSHLDEEGIKGLGDLFSTVTQSLTNTSSQVLVVDHSKLLETAIPKTVKLG